MRTSFIVAAVMAITIVGSAGLLLSEPVGPDGLPNISGVWLGKAKVKAFDMTGQGFGEKEKAKIEVKVSQRGSDLYVTIYPEDGDSIALSGVIGDGHFWLFSDEEGLMMMTGHVKSKGKKIEGRLVGVEELGFFEVGIKLKLAPDEK